MTDLRTAAQQALEALEWHYRQGHSNTLGGFRLKIDEKALRELRAALAQQAEPVEPAFHGFMSDDGTQVDVCFSPSAPRKDGTYATAYYTAPPHRVAQQDEPVEPVAWMFESERNFNLVGYGGWEKRITECRPNALQSSVRNVTPLYTAPPQRKPLTEKEIGAVCAPLGFAQLSPVEVARAVERAHGIKE